MKRLQVYQFLMEPNGEQQRAMRRIAGSCRYVWNKALALQIENHKTGEKFIHHFAMCKWLPVWKKEPDLNRAILDQVWGEFRRQLGYKMDWNGGILLSVASLPTSQTCPCCGQVAKENRLKKVEFLCVACGHADNADVVGAVNMLERGQRLLACAEEGSGRGRKTTTKPASVKQEPTEVTAHEVSHA